MHNSHVFAEEEKLPLTKVAAEFANCKSKAFTVCFTAKVNEKNVAEKLKDLSDKDFKDSK